MNKRRLQRTIFFTVLVGLLTVGSCGMWLRAQRWRFALNRQLIAAVRDHDDREAIDLVKEGADPNTPISPPPVPTAEDLWNLVLHSSPLPHNNTNSAFLVVCGAPYDANGFRERDSPQLVQVMLQHGAELNASDYIGCTPLFCAVAAWYPKTVRVLLDYGANTNAINTYGDTPLHWVVQVYCSSNTGHGITDATEILPQLVAHGANPNLPNKTGVTGIQIAQRNHRPDLVALLRQYGAKK
jgi:hypothetical protein